VGAPAVVLVHYRSRHQHQGVQVVTEVVRVGRSVGRYVWEGQCTFAMLQGFLALSFVDSETTCCKSVCEKVNPWDRQLQPATSTAAVFPTQCPAVVAEMQLRASRENLLLGFRLEPDAACECCSAAVLPVPPATAIVTAAAALRTCHSRTCSVAAAGPEACA
jgi:hypothetical protein